jgi:hypothetical protein
MPPSIRRFLANIILKELVPINFLANYGDTILIRPAANQVSCPQKKLCSRRATLKSKKYIDHICYTKI